MQCMAHIVATASLTATVRGERPQWSRTAWEQERSRDMQAMRGRGQSMRGHAELHKDVARDLLDLRRVA